MYLRLLTRHGTARAYIHALRVGSVAGRPAPVGRQLGSFCCYYLPLADIKQHIRTGFYHRPVCTRVLAGFLRAFCRLGSLPIPLPAVPSIRNAPHATLPGSVTCYVQFPILPPPPNTLAVACGCSTHGLAWTSVARCLPPLATVLDTRRWFMPRALDDHLIHYRHPRGFVYSHGRFYARYAYYTHTVTTGLTFLGRVPSSTDVAAASTTPACAARAFYARFAPSAIWFCVD